MNDKLNVLCLEDSPQDAEIIREQLINSGYILNMDCTAKEKEFVSLLRSREYDIILSDFKLPGFDGFAALQWALKICPDTPFICVSGTVGEENAVELLKKGAVDYVLKDRLGRLPYAIHRALDEAKEKKALKKAEEKVREAQVLLQASIESPKDMAILSINTNYDYLIFNTFHKEFMKSTYGVDINIGMNQLDCITSDDDRLKAKTNYNRAFTGISFITIEEHETNKGQFFEKRYNPIYNEIDEIVGATVFSANITDRKKTEEALKESEQIFNSFMEFSPIYIFFKDQNAKPLRLSKNFEQLLGIPTEEAIGKTMFELFPSKMAKKMIKDDLSVIKSGQPMRVIEEMNNRYYESTKFPIVLNNHPTLLAGFTVDITDRINSEKELLEKLELQELLAKVAETVPGLIISLQLKPNGSINIPYASAATEQIFGLKPEEVINDATLALSLIHPDDIERVNQRLADSAKNLSQFRDEWRVMHPSKGEKWVEGYSMPIGEPDGSIIWHGFFQDITERKEVETKIQKLNEELEMKVTERTIELQETLTLVENIMLSTTVGFLVYNAKGDCILANDAIANILGATKDQLLKQNQHHIESWKKTGLYELSINSISEQVPNSKELFIKTSFGKEVWIDCRFTPFIANNKHNLLLTISDIEERVKRENEIKELNETLQANIEKLELVNKELEAFSYSVSHDLRAPLRAIHGFINILQEDFKEKIDDEGLRLMSVVKDNALRMGLLIDELLAFSRINRTDIKKNKINFSSLVDSVYLEYTNSEQREKIKFRVEKLPDISGDANLFLQVWANLISNAIKYTSKIDHPVIEIGFSNKQDDYEFYIKDNGVGFDMRYSDKLFGVFQRLHSDQEFALIPSFSERAKLSFLILAGVERGLFDIKSLHP